MSGSSFEIGQVLQSRKIANMRADCEDFTAEVYAALEKYKRMDWGETCEKDKPLNDEAAQQSGGMILAKYETSKGAIVVKTDQDRLHTKIQTFEEY